MATNNQLKRIEWTYFEGCNSNVSDTISKKSELHHVENVRSSVIGTIEKRKGTRRLGDVINATANYGIFYYYNDGNTGFYRISTVGGVTSIYYLSNTSIWTALTGYGTGITPPSTNSYSQKFSTVVAENCCFIVNRVGENRYLKNGNSIKTQNSFGDSTAQFDITKDVVTVTYTWDGTGTNPNISKNILPNDIIHIYSPNFDSANNGSFMVFTVPTDNSFTINNGSGVAENNKTLGSGFMSIINNLTGSIDCNKIEYYENKLYLADSNVGNDVYYSSYKSGLVSLVNTDQSAAITTLKVTDTDYLKKNEILDVYRNGAKIGSLFVTAVNTTDSTITIVSFGTDLKNNDELWIGGTYGYPSRYVFRWNSKYNFTIPFNKSGRIKMMTQMGSYLVFGNNNNLAVWDNTSLKVIDYNVGCVSDVGYVKHLGFLFFTHYSGVYAISINNTFKTVTSTDLSPKLISSPIQRIFDGATVSGLEASAMGKKGDSIFSSIGDVTLYYPDGSIEKTLSGVVVEFDIRKQSWYIHTGIKADQFETYISSSNADRLEFSSTDTGYNIYELFNGNLDDNVTSDKEISFRADTGNTTLSKSFENFCNPLYVILETEMGTGMKVFVSLDNGKFYEINGESVKGTTILKINSENGDISQPPRCQKINLSFRDSSKKLCKLKRVALIYTETLENENEKINSFGE